MWSNFYLDNVCGKIKHCEYDYKTAFIPVFAYGYLDSFIWIEARKENTKVLAKEKF